MSQIHKTSFLTCLISFFLVAHIQSVSSAVPDASEIMRQVADRSKGNNVISQVEMVLVEENGHLRTRKLQIFSREDGEKKQRILFFREPVNIAKTALLISDYIKNDQLDNQWIYLPALHKSKRITRDNRANSFMGSDFSHADFITRNHSDFSYRFVKESKVHEDSVWIIEAVPNDSKIMQECGYSKALFLVRQDNYVVIRSVFWVHGKSGTLKYVDVKKLDKISDIWVPMEIHAKTMEQKKVVHQTILRIESISFNNQFSDNLFTVQRLEQGW